MSHSLLVNVTPQETRVALVENGLLAELYVERRKGQSIVGNVYKGKVLRVLPGMQAAFVDIGLDRAAFLYVGDVQTNIKNVYLGEEVESEPLIATSEASAHSIEMSVGDLADGGGISPETHEPVYQPIQNLLQEGQELNVQVTKAPIGTKGARISSYISLPGRHLVLIPTVDHIGISRRITKEAERDRLKNMVEKLKAPGVGYIVRTVCEGKDEEKIKEDMEYLLKVWEEIKERSESSSAPSLIHNDLDLILRATRDLFTANIDRLIVDDQSEYSNLKKFIETYLPRLKDGLELYQGNEPLFDAFNIEADISRALGSKVWLKSGGYIIIDQMEALTAIDVNTGRFVGKKNLEDTILKTNLEAVREIAIQIRLRNIGGIIIIDFIDMIKKTNRDKVFNSLQEGLQKDRARTNILNMSDFGLVEMTRKRTQESLVRSLCEPCPYCEGKAYIKSPHTVTYELFRDLKREGSESKRKSKNCS